MERCNIGKSTYLFKKLGCDPVTDSKIIDGESGRHCSVIRQFYTGAYITEAVKLLSMMKMASDFTF